MILKEIGLKKWAESIANCSNLTLFHTCEWLNSLQEGFSNIEIKLYTVLDEKGRIVGLFPVEVARKGPFKIAGLPLPGILTPYQGPLIFGSSAINLEEVLHVIAKILKVRYFAGSLSPDKLFAKSIGCNTVNWEFEKTILINLSIGSENLWKNFKAETRNQIRQAERLGVEIYEPKSLDEWVDDYYAMHEAVYLRQNIKPVARKAFYQALWKNLYSKNQLKLILARYNKKTIAGGIFPIYKDVIYYIDGVSFREYQKLRANNLIQWHIISWAASAGLRLYDMVGANIPSIAHFKRGFGGYETEYPYFRMFRGPICKTSYWFYQRYRPWFRRLGI